MSFRDWLHNVAVRGCLIAAFTTFLSAGEGCAQGDYAAPPEQSQQQQSTPQQTPVTPDQADRHADTEYYEASCARPKDHDAADLCEQRRMAKAAEDAVWWARFQTFLGIFGFGAVVVSLIFTGWAAFAAGRAAKAAEASVAVARRVGEAQTRAYVSIKSCAIYFGGDAAIPFVEIVAVNSGQSPALAFIWAPTVNYLEGNNAESDPGEEWTAQPGVDISPTSQLKQLYVPTEFDLVDKVAKDGTMPEKVGISVTIDFAWFDVFGNQISDLASFAGVAEAFESNKKKLHPFNTSAWGCHILHPIEKGKLWSGIAVRAPAAAEKAKENDNPEKPQAPESGKREA